jgi:hypothetical protein
MKKRLRQIMKMGKTEKVINKTKYEEEAEADDEIGKDRKCMIPRTKREGLCSCLLLVFVCSDCSACSN